MTFRRFGSLVAPALAAVAGLVLAGCASHEYARMQELAGSESDAVEQTASGEKTTESVRSPGVRPLSDNPFAAPPPGAEEFLPPSMLKPRVKRATEVETVPMTALPMDSVAPPARVERLAPQQDPLLGAATGSTPVATSTYDAEGVVHASASDKGVPARVVARGSDGRPLYNVPPPPSMVPQTRTVYEAPRPLSSDMTIVDASPKSGADGFILERNASPMSNTPSRAEYIAPGAYDPYDTTAAPARPVTVPAPTYRETTTYRQPTYVAPAPQPYSSAPTSTTRPELNEAVLRAMAAERLAAERRARAVNAAAAQTPTPRARTRRRRSVRTRVARPTSARDCVT